MYRCRTPQAPTMASLNLSNKSAKEQQKNNTDIPSNQVTNNVSLPTAYSSRYISQKYYSERLGINLPIHYPMKRLHQRWGRDNGLAWPITVYTGAVSAEVEIDLCFCVQLKQLVCSVGDTEQAHIPVSATIP
jgi:hypothetical protein